MSKYCLPVHLQNHLRKHIPSLSLSLSHGFLTRELFIVSNYLFTHSKTRENASSSFCRFVFSWKKKTSWWLCYISLVIQVWKNHLSSVELSQGFLVSKVKFSHSVSRFSVSLLKVWWFSHELLGSANAGYRLISVVNWDSSKWDLAEALKLLTSFLLIAILVSFHHLLLFSAFF